MQWRGQESLVVVVVQHEDFLHVHHQQEQIKVFVEFWAWVLTKKDLWGFSAPKKTRLFFWGPEQLPDAEAIVEAIKRENVPVTVRSP